MDNSTQLHIHLCKFCYERNYSERKMSLVKYAVSISIVKSRLHVCFICKNFFLEKLPSIVERILNSEMLGSPRCITTIDIGTRIPCLLYENEDYVRSMFQIKGSTGIKNQINLLIREKLRKKENYVIDHLEPDLKFDIVIDNDLNFKIDCKAKEFYLLGRYLKLCRDIPQKDKSLIKNGSQTILAMIDKREKSIEYSIRNAVFSEYRPEDIKITWTGSEDKHSLVLGSGRPFIVKVINPRIKNRYEKEVLDEDIKLQFRKIEHDQINYYGKYRVLVTMLVKIEGKVSKFSHFQKCIQALIGEVTFMVKNRKIKRNIYFAKLIYAEGDKLKISFEMDNGIPIKQFIGGNEPINPCLSNVLKTKCECVYFDISDVILNKSIMK